MKLRVEVTAEDIKRGRRGNCSRCPVARAIRRALGGRRYRVEASACSAWLSGAPIPLPSEAVAFIGAFDARESVQPFTFTLDIPEPTQ